jgi:hypothetical protein
MGNTILLKSGNSIFNTRIAGIPAMAIGKGNYIKTRIMQSTYIAWISARYLKPFTYLGQTHIGKGVNTP